MRKNLDGTKKALILSLSKDARRSCNGLDLDSLVQSSAAEAAVTAA
jgi:hypothetical protein